MKILIIDDDSVIRQLLEDLLPLYLGQADQVFSADDGQRGLDIARREQPDVILIDAHMPIRDGLQTAQALRDDQATRHATLIAMTGSGDSDAVSRGLKSLADFVVDKPFHPDTLLNYLQVAAA